VAGTPREETWQAGAGGMTLSTNQAQTRLTMRIWKAMAILAAVAGCAGARSVQNTNSALGHWDGEIDHGGFSQAIALDIENENGVYFGEWQPAVGLPSKPLENVEVHGDEVRFETDRLRFVGHVTGSRLAGTVTDKVANAPVGEFSVNSSNPTRWHPYAIGT
jgi:hypothetical protein